MDLYLPDDFVPHADYTWSEACADGDASPAREAEDWFGAEAFVAPATFEQTRPACRDEVDWRAL
jgi:hypothetical protein